MTLNTTYSPTVADGNGVTKSFSYSFNPISENYLKVSLEQNGSWVEQVSGWTATVSENGGVVTFDTAPTTRVAIERDVPEEQPTSYKTSSGFQAQVIEHSFDMLTGMVQELKEKSDRSIAVDVGSSVNPQEVVAQVERVYDSIDNIDTVAGDLTNIDAVNANKDNIDIVAGDKANIDIVATNKTNVDKVANNIGSVNRVSPYINQVVTTSMIASDIVRVAQISSDVTAVNANKTNIDIVANNKSDVNTVANNISSVVNVGYNVNHISRVDANKDNIDAVADDITNVNRVGGSINNVNSVAAGLDDISDVLDNMTNIDTVAGSITNVSRVGNNINKVVDVADDLTNIDAVNANKTNIDIVASNNANVSRVGSNINNVNTVANSKTDINTIADNISDVNNVASYLGNISAVASGITEVQAVADDLNNIDGVSQYLGQIENVSDNISNVNEVGSNIANVNTVAGDHTNIQTVVTNLSAIRAAPANAAQAQQWAIGVPGEPSGGSAKYWAERAEDAASGMENPANRDLNNLTATGQMVIDSQNGAISNCILDIPQNIKLTLENNVVTLKAGSIVVRGGEVYTTYTLTEDKSLTISLDDGRYVLFTGATGAPMMIIQNKLGSGTTLPADSSVYGRFFITTNKTFYNWSGAQNAWVESGMTYPIAIIDVINGVASFAKDSNDNDMIFNGAGFVGHHAFVYPGVKALIPDGLNADGSMKSINYTNNALRIVEMSSTTPASGYKKILQMGSTGVYNANNYKEVESYNDLETKNYSIQYVKKDNIIYYYNSATYETRIIAKILSYSYNGTTVTDFAIRQPVRIATTEILDKIQDQVDTKQDIITGAATTITEDNLTANRAVISNGSGKVVVSNVTSTELSYLSGVTSGVQTQLNNKASTSLDNLNSNGQMIIDSQNGTISNCVLDIPQNIKLELSNNVLTLKAGSIVTLTGSSTYTTVTVASDRIKDFSSYSDGDIVVFANSVGGLGSDGLLNRMGSGNTLPSDSSTYVWYYLTTDYSVYHWENSSWTKKTVTYPLCVLHKSENNVSFAKDSNGNDMIFNGAGFIGHHAFVYPNVKALLPDGFNEDGSLKSMKVNNGALRIFELVSGEAPSGASRTVSFHGFSTQLSVYDLLNKDYNNLNGFTSNVRGYIKSENMFYRYNLGVYESAILCRFITYAYNGTTVTDFTIRQPVRTATVEMVDKKQADLTTVSGYDATTTQVLKHINGVLTWVTEE